MKKNILGSMLILTISFSAMANFNLATSRQLVVCDGADSQSWFLNAKRTKIKYTVEGESAGPQKIVKKESDGKTYVSYTTSTGVLTLSDEGDTFLFDGSDEAEEIDCE